MPTRSTGPSGHVPLKSITGEGLLRAVEAEAEALRIIHVRIHKQLQNLEVEEKLLQHMINRVRSNHTEEELQDFDQQYAQEQVQRQQQQQQQRQQQQAPQGGQATPEQQQQQQQEGVQLQELLQEHPLLGKHRQHMGGFKQHREQEAGAQQQQQQSQGQQGQQQPPPQQPQQQPRQEHTTGAAGPTATGT